MSVLPLTDAKVYLNITVDTYDGELQTFIDAAEAVIAQHCGPLSATAKTERVRGASSALVLSHIPAISLTSVTAVDGDALVLADLHLETASGVVTYDSGASFGARHYDVVYSAGRTVSATVNADLLMAVKELVRHMWGTQRGRPRSEGDVAPGAAFLLPNRVAAMIAPHVQSGFA